MSEQLVLTFKTNKQHTVANLDENSVQYYVPKNKDNKQTKFKHNTLKFELRPKKFEVKNVHIENTCLPNLE
jgi:hypothetical protein